MKKKLVLSLGSNLGNRYAYLKQAKAKIEQALNVTCIESQYYETPPWGEKNQAKFLNTVFTLETDVNLSGVFHLLQNIELQLNRTKTKKWGPRTIDIDILFFGNDIVKDEDLTIPHPQMHNRAFVMIPLVNLLPNFVHPVFQKTITKLTASIENDTTNFLVNL
ncbi:2-amino-4-hydroxy-6-hydroxymethyldihydropteridine diphosphokinase [Bacteroidia bacterium]|nr:2-amino-4-hydroxy-6-hydroxymethyldihydropteridine diphosphokinase [Bacteroidia bacterium]MDB4107024.1 2-amino-4-hydroxy-6-hydroxymethyldihydropteridine diphosphokinase [Bacteroidia bacterium]MDB9882483.1 2-amino-4-hydroxy-6-hydroxymethyldihydropteridine diphosphokinase [Bacteroidia bacterium]